MHFLYKAKNSKGQTVTGTVKAPSQYDAEKILVNHGLVSSEMLPEKRKGFNFKIGSKINGKDRVVFSRQLATMISAGLPLAKAITVLSTQARTPRLKNIYLSIYRDLEEGSSFSSALIQHPEMFDRVFISVINSGETTGKLEVVLDQLARQLENDNNFASRIKGVLYYPAFIFIALVGVATYMMLAVIPQLKVMFEQADTQLPIATRMLLWLSDFFTHYWWSVIIIITGLVIGIRFILNTEFGLSYLNRLQLSLPVIKNLAEGVYISRFARTMQMLLSAGVPLLDALKTCSSMMKNDLYEDGIIVASEKVEKGVPLSTELLKNPVFPPLLGQMAAVGEETGQLDGVMGRVADYYEEETSERIKVISSLIEPAVLLIIGFGVAFLVFAILVPVYNLSKVS